MIGGRLKAKMLAEAILREGEVHFSKA